MAALEMARRVRPDVPFLFVSGAIGEELAIETLQRGATDYVLKSRLARLPSAVRRALSLADERRRRERAEADRDRLLESERVARAAAESANRMKDEFLAIASHELRTPLNAILGWATLLSADELKPELLKRGLEIIKRNAAAQSRLIEDILDISRIVTGKLQLHLSSVQPGSFIYPALEAVRPAASAKHVSIAVHVDVPEPIVGDPGRLQQVIWNLLSNAVKFTPPEGRIELNAHMEGERLSISVSDSGQGIDPEFLPHVFERFRQADPSATRRAGGLGLGLSIVRYLVEAHGGSVAVQSAGKGQGTCFTVTLPRNAELDVGVRVETAAQGGGIDFDAPANSSAPLRGVRVLLVEDDADSRELVALILRSGGASVTAAPSAQEALQVFETFRPDILVSDIGMPDMDGYAFIRHVRARPPELGGNTPAVALTAYTRELDRRAAEEAGFHRHVSKPVTGSILLKAVSETLTHAGGARREI
jgi:signal transduction histidine kinase/ActR/RegA family two-component response regulator